MNKQIKYRIYDPEALDGLPDLLYSSTEYFDDSIMLRFSEHFEADPQNLILMEWTEHIDSNGVDIYENMVLNDIYKVQKKKGHFVLTNIITNHSQDLYKFIENSEKYNIQLLITKEYIK